MLDIKNALAYLRRELDKVNKVIDAYEAIADENYQHRRRKAVAKANAKAKESGKQVETPVIPLQEPDPDAGSLWLQ